MARPLIVVGKNRSGTKWLTNLVAGHPDVACPQHERHRGVIECNVLVQAPRVFGSLRHWENRVPFVESLAASDFAPDRSNASWGVEVHSPCTNRRDPDEQSYVFAHSLNSTLMSRTPPSARSTSTAKESMAKGPPTYRLTFLSAQLSSAQLSSAQLSSAQLSSAYQPFLRPSP